LESSRKGGGVRAYLKGVHGLICRALFLVCCRRLAWFTDYWENKRKRKDKKEEENNDNKLLCKGFMIIMGIRSL